MSSVDVSTSMIRQDIFNQTLENDSGANGDYATIRSSNDDSNSNDDSTQSDDDVSTLCDEDQNSRRPYSSYFTEDETFMNSHVMANRRRANIHTLGLVRKHRGLTNDIVAGIYHDLDNLTVASGKKGLIADYDEIYVDADFKEQRSKVLDDAIHATFLNLSTLVVCVAPAAMHMQRMFNAIVDGFTAGIEDGRSTGVELHTHVSDSLEFVLENGGCRERKTPKLKQDLSAHMHDLSNCMGDIELDFRTNPTHRFRTFTFIDKERGGWLQVVIVNPRSYWSSGHLVRSLRSQIFTRNYHPVILAVDIPTQEEGIFPEVSLNLTVTTQAKKKLRSSCSKRKSSRLFR